jgi:hypothetical protein
MEKRLPSFHEKRLQSLKNLELKKVLKRKNPYLYKAKNIIEASELVKSILDAHLSSQEETTFGAFLEDLAIFVCEKIYGGRKSPAEGIDLEFEKDNVVYIVSIKSGPNWGNSRQIKKMEEDFNKAMRILRQSDKQRQIVAINGCCYGKDANVDKGSYQKLCGERFWKLISNQDTLYTDIIEPLGYKAREQNEAFQQEYARVINRFAEEFMREFCDENGTVLWENIIKFNSSSG